MQWEGVLTEWSETPKKRKYKGNAGGHQATFYVDKEADPLPMNELLSITYTENEFKPKDSADTLKLKNLTGWNRAEILTPEQQAHMQEMKVAETPAKELEYAPIYEPPAQKDTFPSIEEQFVKEIMAGSARCGVVNPNNYDELLAATVNCRNAFQAAFSAPVGDGGASPVGDAWEDPNAPPPPGEPW